MKPKVVVYVFPGTNSEDETKRALEASGVDVALVRSDDTTDAAKKADGYVLPGGFAHEDRIRAGAVAAHDRAMDVVIEAAEKGKPVLGICNGAQVLLESGLVPGTSQVRRPSAAFAPNIPGGRFRCVHIYMRLLIAPARSALLAALPKDAVIPAWVAHGEGRLAASFDELAHVEREHLAFVYSDANGDVNPEAVPNGSALGAAGLINKAGNVLAIMPHPERDAWTFMHRYDLVPAKTAHEALQPSGGIALIQSFAKAFV
ncbi:MAG: phosphoribosylformylglycinamidine synthase I [Vulcanimicrobiaceae bacterium]|jgi:phosphoribosylformylglycinamidine synthase